MVDVFISYKRDDRPRAELLSKALTSVGFSVWFDAHIGPNRPFDDEIADNHSAASAVVALWSPGAAKSEWVKAESTKAKEDGKLISCVIERISDSSDFGVPMPFNMYSIYDLTKWNGDLRAPEIRPVLTFVLARSNNATAAVRCKELGLDLPARAPSASPRRVSTAQPQVARAGLVGTIAIVGILLLAVGGGYVYLQLPRNDSPVAAIATAAPQTPIPAVIDQPLRPNVEQVAAPPPPLVPSVPVQSPQSQVPVATPAVASTAPVIETATPAPIVTPPPPAVAAVAIPSVATPIPTTAPPREPQTPVAPAPAPPQQAARVDPAPEPIFDSELERVFRRRLPIRAVVSISPANDPLAMLEARNFDGLSVSFANSNVSFDRVDCTMVTTAARSTQCSWLVQAPGTIRVTATMAGVTRPIILDMRRDGDAIPTSIGFGGFRLVGSASQ